jgi:hypothetical protein
METATKLTEARRCQECRVRRNSWQKGHPKERRRTRQRGFEGERGREERDWGVQGESLGEFLGESTIKSASTSFMEFHISPPTLHLSGTSSFAPDKVAADKKDKRGGRQACVVLIFEVVRASNLKHEP